MILLVHIEKEANRCLNCNRPQCMEYCPVHTSIPEIICLFKSDQLMDAGRILFENNPMSLVCASVCNHEAQCAGHCVLGRKSTAVQFYEIEKYISDAYLDRMTEHRLLDNGHRIAVIGSGPAGLTAAIVLAQYGCDVTIFERKNDIGGMLRYGIPEFRLPRTILRRYEEVLKKYGIKVRLNTTIGGALGIEDLFRDGYSAIFIGSGVWRPRTLGIQGECLAKVHFGISYLENPKNTHLGETVAIIGMGNVAMDVARTAFRHGANRVMLFSRDATATASSHEMSYTRLDGAEFYYGKQIIRIEEIGPVFKDAVLNENGNAVSTIGEETIVPADSIVIAISQRPKDKLILSTDHLEGNAKGLLIVDENGMTTRKGVFAAGDVITGPMTVVHAVKGAKHTAMAMLKYIGI